MNKRNLINILLIFCLVFSNYTMVTSQENSFKINVEPIKDSTNKVITANLSWNIPNDLQDYKYYVMRQNSLGNWENVSTNQSKNDIINVLHVYTHKSEKDIFKKWMYELNEADGLNGNKFPDINVDCTHFNQFYKPFNYNSRSWLFDDMGNNKYDVVAFGFRNSNNYCGLNDINSAKAVDEYINKGGSLLLGHDTTNSVGFKELKNIYNMELFSPGQNIQSDKATAIKMGPITTYPYDLTKESFYISNSHTNGQVPLNDENIYVSFEKNHDQGNGELTYNPTAGYSPQDVYKTVGGVSHNINSFLYVNNNTAVIQTGNWTSNTEVNTTLAEKQLIANTICHLAQSTTETTATDILQDFVSPNITTMNYEQNTRTATPSSKDFGNTYKYRVIAQPKGASKPNQTDIMTALNNPHSERIDSCFISTLSDDVNIIADIKGFVYKIDENPINIPTLSEPNTSILPESSPSYKISTVIPKNKFIHIAAIDNNDNIGPYIHVDIEKTFPILKSKVSYKHYDYTKKDKLITGLQIEHDAGLDTNKDGIIEIENINVGESFTIFDSLIDGYKYKDFSTIDSSPNNHTITVNSNPEKNIINLYYAKELNIDIKNIGHNSMNTTTIPLGSSTLSAEENIPFGYNPMTIPDYTAQGYTINTETGPPIPFTLDTEFILSSNNNISTIYIHYMVNNEDVYENFIDDQGTTLKPSRVTNNLDIGYLYNYNLSQADIDSILNNRCYTLSTSDSSYIFVSGTPQRNQINHTFNRNKVLLKHLGYDYTTSPQALNTLYQETKIFDGNPTETVTAETYTDWDLKSPATKNIDYANTSGVSFIYTKGTPVGLYSSNVSYKSLLDDSSISNGADHTGPIDFNVTNKIVASEFYNIDNNKIYNNSVKYVYDYASFTIADSDTKFMLNNTTDITHFVQGNHNVSVYYRPYSKITITYEIHDYMGNIVTNQLAPMEIPIGTKYSLPKNAPANLFLQEATIDNNLVDISKFDYTFTPTDLNHTIHYKFIADAYSVKINAISNIDNTTISSIEKKHLLNVPTKISQTSTPPEITGYMFDKMVVSTPDASQYLDNMTFNPTERGSYVINLYYNKASKVTFNYIDVGYQNIATPMTKTCPQGIPLELDIPTSGTPAPLGTLNSSIDLDKYTPFTIIIDANVKTPALNNGQFKFTPNNNFHNIYVGFMPKTYKVNVQYIDDSNKSVLFSKTLGPFSTTVAKTIPTPAVEGYKFIGIEYPVNELTYDKNANTIIPSDRGEGSPYNIKVNFKKEAITSTIDTESQENNYDIEADFDGENTSPTELPSIILRPTPNPSDVKNEIPKKTNEKSIKEEVPFEVLGVAQEEYTKWRKVIMKGYPNNSFRPNTNITRCEVAAVIYNLEKHNKKTEKTDTKNTNSAVWYDDAVNYVKDNNIMSGYLDGSFKPNQPITRAEFLIIVNNIIDVPNELEKMPTAFKDTENHWAASQINAVTNALKLKGFGDAMFRPDNYLQRKDFAVIISKATKRYEYVPIQKFSDIDNKHYAYPYIMSISNYCK